ncbi:S26 family signal peptidase [Streptomyces bobili]|uniref:S26 family signal peptidase n=1 Tax=Streptomyces bobili TaxID=67280 RepID=UPI0022507C2A|nr:S26 family signal peptidase [Streptomyces bobili]MCX5528818.1 S26 family signal peptidase [Streptomyces bobili]
MVVAPVDPAKSEAGGIVLARGAGTVHAHLVSSVDPVGKRVRISNDRGLVNGWSSHDRVCGVRVAGDGVTRSKVAGETLAADSDDSS